jgi:hypothetical protein
MKKREVKKLQLSRETLHGLTSSDVEKVMAGTEIIRSCPSNCMDTIRQPCETE